MKYVGKSQGRIEGMAKVTGRALYAADLKDEDMLEAVLVRSTIAHGIIKEINTEALPEGIYCYTGADYAENIIEDIIDDQPALALDKVRYIGEPVAIVAAETRKLAEIAADLVKVEYEELEMVEDPVSAAEPEAPALHPAGNVFTEYSCSRGDLEAGWAQAACIIEKRFTIPEQEHGYIEPEAGVSFMDGDMLCLISPSQNVFHDRRMVARALGLPIEKVYVKSPHIGGAFGGKDGHMTQLFTALVTLKTGRPCRMVFTRGESIRYTSKRHSMIIDIKFGFAGDGRMTAFKGQAFIDTGAYIGYGASVCGLTSEHMAGPYRIPNVEISSHLCYTNKPMASAFRGFGAPQAAFAAESVIEMAAEQLGMDSIQIRRINALREGDTGLIGQRMEHSVGALEVLDRLEQTRLWQESKSNGDPYTGYGLALGHLSCGFGKQVPDNAGVRVHWTRGSKARLYCGFSDMGQGNRTSIAAVAADALGLDFDDIEMIMADTGVTLDCGPAAASRSTFIAGLAIESLAEEFRDRMAAGAEEIELSAETAFPEAELADPYFGLPHVMYTFVGQIAKVKVDPLTGCYHVTDMAAVTEAGTIVNPVNFHGQIEGGMVQSLGYATGEDPRFVKGRAMNGSFSTYLMPTAMDAPHIESYAVDGYEPIGPLGVKGAAEAPTVPTMAAINIACHKVTGTWSTELPISPETNLKGIMAKGEADFYCSGDCASCGRHSVDGGEALGE